MAMETKKKSEAREEDKAKYGFDSGIKHILKNVLRSKDDDREFAPLFQRAGVTHLDDFLCMTSRDWKMLKPKPAYVHTFMAIKCRLVVESRENRTVEQEVFKLDYQTMREYRLGIVPIMKPKDKKVKFARHEKQTAILICGDEDEPEGNTTYDKYVEHILSNVTGAPHIFETAFENAGVRNLEDIMDMSAKDWKDLFWNCRKSGTRLTLKMAHSNKMRWIRSWLRKQKQYPDPEIAAINLTEEVLRQFRLKTYGEINLN